MYIKNSIEMHSKNLNKLYVYVEALFMLLYKHTGENAYLYVNYYYHIKIYEDICINKAIREPGKNDNLI